MRLSCETHINYRNTGKIGRRLGLSTLTISPNLRDRTQFHLVITTRQTSVTFKNLKDNIIKIFSSCIRQGKLTISMKTPDHDVLIKNAPLQQLEGFHKILMAAVKGIELPKTIVSQPPTKIVPRTRKLHITQRSEYPLRGFPAELEILIINDIRLSRLQNSILNLSNLQELVIENNELDEVPKSLQKLNLKKLSLKSNRISKIFDIFGGNLLKSLIHLDLSHNNIKHLPASICLANLAFLDVSHNHLEVLPVNFVGTLRLATLKLQNNGLLYLPPDLYLSNGSIDISENFGLLMEVPQNPRVTPESPSLLELAGRKLAPYRFRVRSELLPLGLYRYLLTFVLCSRCKRPCYPSSDRKLIRRVDLSVLAKTFVSAGNGDDVVNQLDFRCSLACAR